MDVTWLKNDTPKISALKTHKSAVATPLKFYIFGVTKYAKYGQVCIFDKIKFLADFPIVITM